MTRPTRHRARPSPRILAVVLALLVVPLSHVPRAEAISSPYGPAPSISADGRYVAFASTADNLSAEDNDPAADIFVRDLQTGAATLVNRATGPTGAPGDRGAEAPAISGDGRFVAFASEADNLSDEDTNSALDIFVRDLQANTTTLVSRASGASGAPGDLGSIDPSISADGRFVAFDSLAHSLSAEDSPAVLEDTFVRDMQANTTTLVSRASGISGVAADTGGSVQSGPSISADGRYVAFDSLANNLSTEDYDVFGTQCQYFHGWFCYSVPVGDVFVRDLQASTTTFASRASGAAGKAFHSTSLEPSISADGRHVAFSTCRSGVGRVRVEISVRDLQSESTTSAGDEPTPGGIGCGAVTVAPDTTPPKTKITKRPPNRTHQQTVKFKFQSSEPNSTFRCRLDKKRFKACGSPTKFKRLKRGKHRFEVRARDAAGNVDRSPAKDTFKVLKPKRRR